MWSQYKNSLHFLWGSIPSQLAKENKKFIYGLVREDARAKDCLFFCFTDRKGRAFAQ